MLDIDTAIKHCLEVAEQNETQADKWQEEGGEQWGKTTACRECATDHRQLAEWLTELRELRDSLGAVKLKDMKEAVGILQELNTENNQLTSQLAEAKRLLKLVVEDMKTLVRCDSVQDCLVCKYQLRDCDGFAFEWKHMEDVNNLINPIE